MTERVAPAKSDDAYRTISEVADELKLPQHVLRFWETRFPQIKPLKRAGGRRFYRPEDIALLRAIRALLYGQGYTIKGVQRMLQEHGPRGVTAMASPALVAGHHRPRQDGEIGLKDEARDSEEAVPPASIPATGSAHQASQTPGSPSVATDHRAGDLRERLQAVLRDLAECSRLIAAASSTQNGRTATG